MKAGGKISVWLGAFSDHWSEHSPKPGDAWVAATVLGMDARGGVKAQRDANAKMVSWVKAGHWKELVESDE